MSQVESDFTEAMRMFQRIFQRRRASEEELERTLNGDSPMTTIDNNHFNGGENENANANGDPTPDYAEAH